MIVAVRRRYHRAQADRLAGRIIRSLEQTGETEAGLDEREPMWAERYHHLAKLEEMR